MWNALARLTCTSTAPGVPDVYQGDELWFQALVDPDNRRPVDWAAREERLRVGAPRVRVGGGRGSSASTCSAAGATTWRTGH